jgi:hypothetical protein
VDRCKDIGQLLEQVCLVADGGPRAPQLRPGDKQQHSETGQSHEPVSSQKGVCEQSHGIWVLVTCYGGQGVPQDTGSDTYCTPVKS